MLSSAGLLKSSNIYLKYGSEFDQHVAYSLLGQEGYDLLETDGDMVLISCSVPGDKAIIATHRYFSPKDFMNKGEVPNLVKEFLMCWSFWHSNPNFEPKTLQLDCGLVLMDDIPTSWILDVVKVSPGELS